MANCSGPKLKKGLTNFALWLGRLWIRNENVLGQDASLTRIHENRRRIFRAIEAVLPQATVGREAVVCHLSASPRSHVR